MTTLPRSFPARLLPSTPGLRFHQAALEAQTLTISLATSTPNARCPRCQRPSRRIHSRYVRTPADLPWAGVTVRLHLTARRFVCPNPACSQRIFVERLPELVAPHARVTARLQLVLRLVAFALGGEAGARLCHRLGFPSSGDRLLTIIRRTPLATPAAARTIGLDDFALRKGARYGSLVVDLETHRVIDLLPDRNAATVEAWLKAHPTIATVTRDRYDAYAVACRRGAPRAEQVVDRWHVMKNVGDALEKVVARFPDVLRRVAAQLTPASPTVPAPSAPAARRASVPKARRRRKTPAQAAWRRRYVRVHALRAKGLTITRPGYKRHPQRNQWFVQVKPAISPWQIAGGRFLCLTLVQPGYNQALIKPVPIWLEVWFAKEMQVLRSILNRVQSVAQQYMSEVRHALARWTKPIARTPVLGSLADLARSKPQLIAENLLLRQQLVVLNRSVKRPRLTPVDRGLFVLLASKLAGWQEALLIVKPETILRWHRAGFRLFWKRKSRAPSHAPKIPAETIRLIKELATTNRLWGAERIRGELLKLGIPVAKRTVQRYMRQARPPRPRGQTWATFLRNHASDIWACDFLQVHDLVFRPLFTFFITELSSRRIVHAGVTRSPTDAWVAQQLREATPFSVAPTYLFRDHDAKYGPQFDAVARGSGIAVLKTPVQAPRANAICERLIGSVRRECLDHVLILSEQHLRHMLKEYSIYFNQARPHQGIQQRIPAQQQHAGPVSDGTRRIVAFPVLGELHHDYRRAAWHESGCGNGGG